MPGSFIDFDIQILPGIGIRRFWKPQARFLLDGAESFFPLPAQQAAPMFEWGLNWCVASRALGFLVMHAGMLAKSGEALMMPGFPGAGKSTLCASLCFLAGWQLLSDELAILDPVSGEMLPHPRPISLKNNSIEIVAGLPAAAIGPTYTDTRKGTISHAYSQPGSTFAADAEARVKWVVFPRFSQDVRGKINEISRAEAFSLISEQSFNRERMGDTGFIALCKMLSAANCYQIVYGSTQDGLQLIREVTDT